MSSLGLDWTACLASCCLALLNTLSHNSQARTLDCSHHNNHPPSHCFLLLQVMEELE